MELSGNQVRVRLGPARTVFKVQRVSVRGRNPRYNTTNSEGAGFEEGIATNRKASVEIYQATIDLDADPWGTYGTIEGNTLAVEVIPDKDDDAVAFSGTILIEENDLDIDAMQGQPFTLRGDTTGSYVWPNEA